MEVLTLVDKKGDRRSVIRRFREQAERQSKLAKEKGLFYIKEKAVQHIMGYYFVHILTAFLFVMFLLTFWYMYLGIYKDFMSHLEAYFIARGGVAQADISIFSKVEKPFLFAQSIISITAFLLAWSFSSLKQAFIVLIWAYLFFTLLLVLTFTPSPIAIESLKGVLFLLGAYLLCIWWLIPVYENRMLRRIYKPLDLEKEMTAKDMRAFIENKAGYQVVSPEWAPYVSVERSIANQGYARTDFSQNQEASYYEKRGGKELHFVFHTSIRVKWTPFRKDFVQQVPATKIISVDES